MHTIFFFIFICQTVVGSENNDRHLLESVLSELNAFKNIIEICNLKLEITESLQARLASLEDQVADLKIENEILNKRIQELEESSETTLQHGSQDLSLKEQTQESVALKPKRYVRSMRQILRHPTQKKIRQTAHNEVSVVFTVGVSVPTLANLGDQQTIIFDKVICNIGQAYHPHSGIFLAPVKGVYVFTVTLMVPARHSLYFEIVLDGNAIADVFADAGNIDVYVSHTRQWVFPVNKSSEVLVRTSHGGEVRGFMHTGFSGFLLYEME